MDPTDTPPAQVRAAAPSAALCYLVFFLSGAAGLVYEVSWSRQIGLLFGHTVHAAAVVLTSFFAGLAAGYVLGGWLAARVHPLRAYAAAEVFAAGWACLVPVLLSTAETSAAAPFLHSTSPSGSLLVRWVFCFLLLLPATAALGATLPTMAEWLSPRGRTAVGRVAVAYAFNTAGAMAGVGAATAWLLVTVGVCASSCAAAGLSAACGVAAFALSRRRNGVCTDSGTARVLETPPPLPEPMGAVPSGGTSVAGSLLLAGVSGFGILALEVLYTRMFSLVFHNSTYTFGAILAAVLLALALGPVLVRVLAQRLDPHRVVAWAGGLGSVAVVASVLLFARVTRLEYFQFGDGFASYLLGVFGLVVLVVLPPITLLGMVLPAVWYGSHCDDRGAGWVVGRTAVVNALAAAAGAACASLLALPTLGLWASFGAVAAVFAVLAGGMLVARRRPGAGVLSGLVFLLASVPLINPPGPERWAEVPSDEVLVRRWESAYGWVDVVREGDRVLKIRQNMHYRFGTTGADAPRAYRQAHLPLLLHSRPADVLFLGLGTGLTAAGAIPHPEVERAVVVELVPEVVDAARLLADANLDVVDHPKFDVRIDDARHFLLVTDRHFDVIVSDLFVPWESEAGYLYTVEHYRAAKRRLKPGGLFCQWLAVYQLGPRELELIADSFAAVYPNTSLWWGHVSHRRPIIALVGTDGPLVLDAPDLDGRLRRLRDHPPVDKEVRTAQDVYELYLGDWQPRRPDRLNTDEHPRVEFLTPVSHRSGDLLHGDALRRYYDAVLVNLSERGVRFDPGPGRPRPDRGWQRTVLFPE